MNRPMFQTPQMRQGAGIMAGVAPIRGYADGDEVSDDDRSERLMAALSNLGSYISDKSEDFGEGLEKITELASTPFTGIASLLGDAYEEYSPEELQAVTDIIGEYLPDADDYLEEDFIDFSPSEYKLGTGEERMNLRDITDLIYDPTSAVDNALLGIAATGVGAPAALMTKLGKSGIKGTNLLNRLLSGSGAYSSKNIFQRTAIPQGILERLGRMQGARGIASLPFAVEEGIAEGMAEPDEMNNYANGGVATLKARDGIFVDFGKFIGNKLGRLLKGDKGKLDEFEAEPPKIITSKKDATKTKTDDSKTKTDETETKTDAQQQQQTLVKNVADEVIDEGMKKPGLLRKTAKYGTVLGTGAGLYWLGNKLIDPETNEEVDPTTLPQGSIPPKPDKEEEDDEVKSDNTSWLDKTFSRLRGVAGTAFDKLDDPRVRAGLMAAAKPVEGYTPVNALVAASEGARQYDLEQAQLAKLSEDAKSDLQQQFELLRPFTSAKKKADGSMETEQDISARLMKSLFAQNELAQKLQVLLELRKSGVPVAESNIQELFKVMDALGGGLTPSQMINPSP